MDFTGPTSPRYAYSHMTGQLGRPSSVGPSTWHAGRPLGQVEGGEDDCPWWDITCPGNTIPGELPGLPGTGGGDTGAGAELPGFVTEQQCAQRESAAYQAGQDAARSNLILTTVVTGVVSALVGAGVSYVLKQ